MRRISEIIIMLCLGYFLQAQTLDELKNIKTELEAAKAEKQAEADAFNSEIASLASKIKLLSGWSTSFSGMIGFDFNKSNNWASNPNPDSKSTSLNIGFTGVANRIQEKYFWRNKGIISKSWQDVDLSKADSNEDGDGLFDNSIIDIINLSSLYGYRLNDKIALSALGEINTSVENFFKPGTFDIGTGATWIPRPELVLVVHPVNYHVAFSAVDAVESEGTLGVKIRADYTKSLNLSGKSLNLSSTFTTFIPYQKKDPTLFEYTWLNTFSYEIWKGLGLGFNFGLRSAEFESEKTQTFYSLGLTFTMN